MILVAGEVRMRKNKLVDAQVLVEGAPKKVFRKERRTYFKQSR